MIVGAPPQPFRTTGWLSGAADVNGDGLDDVLVGTGNGNGEAFVALGKRDGATVSLAGLPPSSGIAINGVEQSGWAVAGAGDVDGDGLGDFIVGSPSNGAGRAQVLLGWDMTQNARRETRRHPMRLYR